MLVTIFTPTYNRSYIINQLYKSLINQTNKDFEWLIVDDGSTDNTEEFINGFINDDKISIRFFKQPNSGKHIAINTGLSLAKGKLFFIVDSDDYLVNNAIELITSYKKKLFQDQNLAGLSFRRGYSTKNIIGSHQNFKDIKMSVLDFRFTKKVKGDQAEIYKTKILKHYKFPCFENEKFCPEGLIWNRIGKNYKLLWTSKVIYICQYLEDGLTSKIIELREKSPRYSMLYYSELEKHKIPFVQKLKANINFWRFSFECSNSMVMNLKSVSFFNSLVGFPVGVLMHLKDKLTT